MEINSRYSGLFFFFFFFFFQCLKMFLKLLILENSIKKKDHQHIRNNVQTFVMYYVLLDYNSSVLKKTVFEPISCFMG